MEYILPIRAKHYNNEFTLVYGCAMAVAAREAFNTTHAVEHVKDIDIDDKTFTHPPYTYKMYKADKAIAESRDFDNSIIRKVILTPIAYR